MACVCHIDQGLPSPRGAPIDFITVVLETASPIFLSFSFFLTDPYTWAVLQASTSLHFASALQLFCIYRAISSILPLPTLRSFMGSSDELRFRRDRVTFPHHWNFDRHVTQLFRDSITTSTSFYLSCSTIPFASPFSLSLSDLIGQHSSIDQGATGVLRMACHSEYP